MSLTLVRGIALSSRSEPDPGVQFGEHFFGQGEVPGRQAGRPLGIPRDDRLGQFGMLVHSPPPDFGGVGLGVEAEADLPADPGTQPGQPRVVRGLRDRPVQGLVGEV
jgi:hypothetical protein